MRKISKITFLLLILASPLTLSSQEIVNGIEGNAVAEKYYSHHKLTKKNTLEADTLELPFIDDFSDSNVQPKPGLWSDNSAFVNSTYPVYPPSVGVVTLDALNYDGTQYPNAGYIPYQADYLTSQPINLDYPVSDSIYLSFFYQAGGLGKPPDLRDSLLLDFYLPEAMEWKKIWAVPGNSLAGNFKRVMIKIDDPSYLAKGFKFRFRNYASQLENSDLYDKRANVDMWNIDYIKLDKSRSVSDTVLRDVCFVNPIRTILKDYTAIPWPHFEAAFNTQRATYIEAIIQNLDSISRNIGTVLEIRDLVQSKPVYKVPSTGAYYNDIVSGDSMLYKYSYNYNFDFSSADTAALEIRTILKTDLFDYKPNDTLRFIQKFYDYYALDDGTAEASYGLRGAGTKDASSALKYNSFVGDSLRAIDFYFVQLVDSLNLDYYFYLDVWADNNGKPGTQLVNQIGMQPKYSDQINKFVRYKLETPVYISGTFYIGFTQTVEKLLNVGLDMNKENKSRIFNNVENGIWKTTTTLPGTPMMRPVFHKDKIIDNLQPGVPVTFTAYPNPCSDFLYISTDLIDTRSGKVTVELIDITGRIIRNIDLSTESGISTGDLQNGMYFLRMSDSSLKKSSTLKIIISH